MKNKWLVSVTAGTWQVFGIKQAQKLGYKVVGIDANENAEGFEYCDLKIAVDLKETDLILKELKKMNINICGALSLCSEAGMNLAAKIREEFNLKGPNLDLTEKLINKKRQRSIWKEKKVSGPNFSVAKSLNEAKEIISKFETPFIIKPVDSAGSRGVFKIEEKDGLIDEKIQEAFSFSISKEIIIESYMDGTEFTVETFCDDHGIHVLCITEKKKISGVGGVVAYELATANRDTKILKKISDLVVEAFEALEYNCGPGHAEVILMKDNSVGIVEVAGRGGGFNVFNKFIKAVSGYDIVKNTVSQALDGNVEAIKKCNHHGVLRFFPSREGYVESYQGFDEVEELESVVAGPFVQIGDKVKDANSDGDRLGFIMSWDKNHEKAFSIIDNAEKRIKFNIVEKYENN